MPQHTSGEGYDYSAFLDVLVYGTSTKAIDNSTRTHDYGEMNGSGTIRNMAADDTRLIGGMAHRLRHHFL